MPYQLFCKSVRGASHVKRDIPCEDYGLKYENSEIGCKIFVLGDGHGDPNCVRSQIGSRAVCEIAVKELRTFAEILNKSKKNCQKNESAESESDGWICSGPPNLVETLLNPDTAGNLVYQLVRSIVGKWGIYVTDHYENNPFTEEEKEIASEMLDAYQRGEHTEHIYGTTMIAGLMTEDYLLLLHQGDGRCVVFDCGGAASQPVPWDVRCVGNLTTSMCEYDALESCRYHVIDLKKNPVIACVIGSDGVEDSFGSMDRMHIFYREQLSIACEKGMGVEELETYWESSLPTFSATGSRDDVTICGVIDIDAFREKLELMDVENDILALKESLELIDKRIPQMQAKEDFLLDRKKEGAKAYNALAEKKRRLEKDYYDILRDLQELQKNDTQPQGNFFQSFQAGAQSFMQRFRLSITSQKCLEQRLDTIKKEKNDLDQELFRAENEQNARIKEYEEYKKEREQLQETRIYKAEKLKECECEFNAILNATPIGKPISQSPESVTANADTELKEVSVTAFNTEMDNVIQNPNEGNEAEPKTEAVLNEETKVSEETVPNGADVASSEETERKEQEQPSDTESLETPVSEAPETASAITEEAAAEKTEPAVTEEAAAEKTAPVTTEETVSAVSEPIFEKNTEVPEW